MSEVAPENLDLEAQRLARYLAGRPSSFWAGATGADRLAVLRHLVQALADLGADAEGAPRAETPELPPHATHDLLLIVAHDLRTAVEQVQHSEPTGADQGEYSAALPLPVGLSEIVLHRGQLDGTGVPAAWAEVVDGAQLGCVRRR